MDKKKPVLADHKKRGKVLIPPFTYLVGPLQDVSWVRTMIPELCWIAFVHEKHGSRHAVKLLTSFTRAVRETATATSHTWLAPCSNYLPVSEPEWARLRESLSATGELFEVQEALAPLVALYPDCPLRWIFTAAPAPSADAEVTRMKVVIKTLFRRADRDPMMAQASALWLAFDAGILKEFDGTSLARFPEIHRYPETEISREIGGAIRSSLNTFFGTKHHYRPESAWPQYFWNRGLTISACEFSDG
ncbi:MAG: hypothetical protein ACREVH_10425 [Gammaproteobacteria bacterium]